MEYQLSTLPAVHTNLCREIQRHTVSSLCGNLEAWIVAVDWMIDSRY